MPQVAKELLTIDLRRLDLRAGVLGVAVLSVFGVATSLVGAPAMAAVIGALVVLSADPPAKGRSTSAAELLPLMVGGTVLTLVAAWIGARPVPAALLAGVVGAAAALLAGRSHQTATRGLIATVWVILALTLHVTGIAPVEYAVAFAVGAAGGTAVAWARARSAEDSITDDVERGPTATDPSTPGALLHSPQGRFAILRGVGLAVAVLLGFTWFPAHPAWVAITAVIVMRPPTRRALVVGAQRSLGTGAGVIVAVALAEAIGDNTPGLVALFLASAFMMMAVREVNYALFAMLVTALVVYAQRILGSDAAESGRARLLETILGVAIALTVLGLAEALDPDTSTAG